MPLPRQCTMFLSDSAFCIARLGSATIVFLDVVLGDAMPEVFAAFTPLHHIVGILRMGPEDAVRHADTLTDLMSRHLEAVVKLYSDAVCWLSLIHIPSPRD